MYQYNKAIQKWLKLMVLWRNIRKNNPNYLQICDHLYKLFILWGSRFGNINALPDQINPLPDLD